jgi:hypothetical protein
MTTATSCRFAVHRICRRRISNKGRPVVFCVVDGFAQAWSLGAATSVVRSFFLATPLEPRTRASRSTGGQGPSALRRAKISWRRAGNRPGVPICAQLARHSRKYSSSRTPLRPSQRLTAPRPSTQPLSASISVSTATITGPSETPTPVARSSSARLARNQAAMSWTGSVPLPFGIFQSDRGDNLGAAGHIGGHQ